MNNIWRALICTYSHKLRVSDSKNRKTIFVATKQNSKLTKKIQNETVAVSTVSPVAEGPSSQGILLVKKQTNKQFWNYFFGT